MKKIYILFAVVLGTLLFEAFNAKIQTNNSQYSVIVKPQSSYVLSGDSFVADIYLAKKIPEPADLLILGSAGKGENVVHQDGKIHYAAVPFAQGLQTFSGTLSIKNESGVSESYPFSTDFMVARQQVSVCSKYLVKGIDNQLDVSAEGIPAMNLQVESTDGIVVAGKTPGIFSINPVNVGKCTITVKSNSKIIFTGNFEVIEKK